MNFAVPMNRAMLSDHWPKASGSKRGSVRRPGSRGWSSRRGLATGTPSGTAIRGRRGAQLDRLVVVAVPPVLREQVVEHVVDGDRADKAVVGVDHRHADEVVRRHPPGD